MKNRNISHGMFVFIYPSNHLGTIMNPQTVFNTPKNLYQNQATQKILVKFSYPEKSRNRNFKPHKIPPSSLSDTLNPVTCISKFLYRAYIFHCIFMTNFDLSDCVTEVSITPSTLWGGQGLLGTSLSFFLL